MTTETAPPDTGYFRHPSVAGDIVVFVSEDDLWLVPRIGGVARRLTSNLGPVARPALSPDGLWVAFTGTEEHHAEVYLMPAEGGQARRVTYLGGNTQTRGWTPGGDVLFVSDAGQPFAGDYRGWTVDVDGGQPQRLPLGPLTDLSYGPDGGAVLGRFTMDPARWKRYRGGRAGVMWIDRNGDGAFNRLLPNLDGNVACPMWLGNRIYFLSDHEGIGNLYSCRPTGRDLKRHTDHGEHYARWAHTDGRHIVYQHAAELWCYDPARGQTHEIDIDFRSPRVSRNRRFVEAAKFLHSIAVHPDGHAIALNARGKLHTMPLWEGAVRQYGEQDGVRYRQSHWTHDGNTIVTVSDAGGDEAIEIHDVADPTKVTRLDGLDVGRATELVPSPTADIVAVANHRTELVLVDLARKTATVVDSSGHERITGLAWSPDGRWLAYSSPPTAQTRVIKLCEVATGDTHTLTRPEFRDFRPSFDPEGKYLYFLSQRVFDPVYDMAYFDLGFPRTVRPHLITLQADTPNPFEPQPRGFGEKPNKPNDDKKDDKKKEEKPDAGPPTVKIDMDGITGRVAAFPVAEGRYGQIWGIKGKALFTNFPIAGSLGRDILEDDDEPRGKLEVYDFKNLKQDTLAQGVSTFRISQDGATLVYASGPKLRALKAGEKPDSKHEKDPPSRESGWIDTKRVRVSVDPPSEYRQMFQEAWRFQKDHFWVPDLSGVDWQRVRDRYRPLVEKVATRAEFSDLMWETLGELGTSHAYEIGGDHRRPPPYPVGQLGCDYTFSPRTGRWTIAHIVRGDSWDASATSPLAVAGTSVREGDTLLAVNGRRTGPDASPQSLLVNLASQRVELTIGDRRGRNPRTVTVKTLPRDTPARYREWVEANRATVHAATRGRAGYIHVPDMGPPGYSEFHRQYFAEVDRDALIVDVRHNGGGHVSPLIIEKLARRRIGYDVPRWGEPEPYPPDSPAGPLVCITDESAGSDGDIFTHVFKLLELGPVVGKRTWGGVIGINIRHVLVDNGRTTQPEFSFWFRDVGWDVENYGTDPTHEVDVRPQDASEGRDPQMDKAIDLVQRALRRHKPERPQLKTRRKLPLPKLPPR